MSRGEGNPVAHLCAEHGYPKEVERALRGTVEALLPLEPRAVVLLGSASRGELTWRSKPEGLELLSDLELACFTDRGDARAERAARSRLAGIEAGTALPNDLFHIDVLVGPRFPSGDHARGLLWYEAGRSHRVLHGAVEPEDFGEVEPGRVRLGLINELVVIRLWWMLVHLPARLLDGRDVVLPEVERERLLYVQLRNLLDVASIWLPNVGIFEVGYGARSRRIGEQGSDLPGAGQLPAAFPHWLSEATLKKLTPALDGDPVEWYRRAVASFRGLVAFLTGCDPEDPRLAVRAGRTWARMHPVARSWRFRAYRAVTTLRQAARPGGLRWLVRRGAPAGDALAFLLEMHRAALARLEGREEASEAALDRAGEALAALVPNPPVVPGSDSFGRRWHTLRGGLVEPFIDHYRKLRGQRERVLRRLRSEEDALA